LFIEMIEQNAHTAERSLKKAVRAVIMHDDKLLLMYLAASNTYVLPGGGVEQGETLTEALHREVLEEVGAKISAFEETLVLREYHLDIAREHHFYRVTLGEKGLETVMTEEEKNLKMTPVFKSAKEALDLLATNVGSHPYSDAIQKRELIGILHSI